MTRILSIDQAQTGKLGWAVFEGADLVAYGCEDYKGVKSSRARLNTYAKLLLLLLESYDPHILILEMVRLWHGGKITFPTIKMLAGLIAVTEVFTDPEIPVWLINTSSWKVEVLGSGKASKDDAIRYAKDFYKIDVNEHEADAICMNVYLQGHIRLGGPVEVKNILEMCK